MEKQATATNCALLARKDQEAEARMVKREDRTDESTSQNFFERSPFVRALSCKMERCERI